ncbi:hypothetical protein, partial [Pontibacter sp. H249]|uniref:hypothetical protein n=1 Tax=Pontibacter sp. H249 TaxID=3133420 RepID=UPI0030C46670
TLYLSSNLYFKSKYRLNFKSISLIGELNFHHLINHLKLGEFGYSQSPSFINPSVGLDWRINEKNKLITTYSFNTTNAGVLDVHDNFILTGIRSFNKGTGNFNQFNASSVLLNYQHGGWSNQFLVNSSLLYSKNHDFFSSKSFVNQNFSLSEKILIKDREFVSFTTDIDQFVNLISSNLKLSVGFSKSNYKNIVNDNLRLVKSINYSYGLEARSALPGFFNFHIGSEWTRNLVETSIRSSFTNNLSFVDLLFKIDSKSNIQLQTERYFFGQIGRSNTYYFIDLNWRYTVKENKLTIVVNGNNLLDNRNFRTTAVSDISVLRTDYQLLPRSLLLTLEYRL